tara:strand:+ start:178 stop:1176 length:999 start_codon:yes stop_codon:yes gene_type:complete
MSYIPKSKINVKEAYGNEFGGKFVRLNSSKPYIGPYIETSEGKFFTGSDIRNKGEEIIIIQETAPNFGKGKDFDTYLEIKPTPYNFLSRTKPIPSTKNKPTKKDYERGYYNRYFASRVNHQFGYQEINFKTYNSLNSGKKEYDHHLHDAGLIKWAISGNVHKINQSNLIKLEDKFPSISTLFPIFNEFHRPGLKIQTDLFTEGKELYFIDGKEYIGFYHIHPMEGPMEGKIHINEEHEKLYYTKQPLEPSEDLFEDFLRAQKCEEMASNARFPSQEAKLSWLDECKNGPKKYDKFNPDILQAEEIKVKEEIPKSTKTKTGDTEIPYSGGGGY